MSGIDRKRQFTRKLAGPTAVAGLYGMNFDDMPELHWPHGYFFVVVLILASCFYLYRRLHLAEWL